MLLTQVFIMKSLALLKLLCIIFPFTSNAVSSTLSTFEQATISGGDAFAVTSLTEHDSSQVELPCRFSHGLVLGNRTRELQCCEKVVERYHNSWFGNSRPLNRYLATLKTWNCPDFSTECDRRYFAFNTFTELMYDYFCNYTQLTKKCFENVSREINSNEIEANSHQSEDSTFLTKKNTSITIRWKKLINQIKPTQMTIDQLLKPCVQVAQYDQEDQHDGEYQEIVEYAIPFCGISWCGFGGETMKTHIINVWTCLSAGCKSGVVVIMVSFAILGAVIAVLNLLIILVLTVNKSMRNNQSVYKLSLAIADLLVGLIVLPICVENLRRLIWTRHELPADTTSVKGYRLVGGNISDNLIEIEVIGRAGGYATKFPVSFRNFAGFVTAISIFVSVYTLMGAGFDRLKAVAKPFAYKKKSAYSMSIKACVIFWITAIIFGLLPIFISDVSYGLILSTIFASFDVNGYIMYAVVFFVPLVIVWIVNILTFCSSKKHSAFRRSLTQAAQEKRQRVERRLAATLRLMVGVFTLGTLPLLLLLLFQWFIPTLSPQYPKVFNAEAARILYSFQFVTLVLLLGNSLWNFFIYSARNKEFRFALRTLLQKISKNVKLSVCINCLFMCWHDINRKSSTASTLSSSRKNTQVTVCTKLDTLCTEESGSSSNVETPKLNGCRKQCQVDCIAEQPRFYKKQLNRYSKSLDSIDEDLHAETASKHKYQWKKNGCDMSVVDINGSPVKIEEKQDTNL